MSDSLMLQSLPIEIIDQILEIALARGTSDPTSRALTTLCKAFYPSVICALYKDIEIWGYKQLQAFHDCVPRESRAAVRCFRLFLSDSDPFRNGDDDWKKSNSGKPSLAVDVMSTLPRLRSLHLGPLESTTLGELAASGSLASLHHLAVSHPLVTPSSRKPLHFSTKRLFVDACSNARSLSLHGTILDVIEDDVDVDNVSGSTDAASKPCDVDSLYFGRVKPLAVTHPHLTRLELSMAFIFPVSLFEGLRLESLTLKYMSIWTTEKIISAVGHSLRQLTLGGYPQKTVVSTN
jgi:hypothetical protein